MRLKKLCTSLVVAVVLTAFMSSCIGQFALFNKLRTWNQSIGSKWTNELVFIAFWIVPVYEIAGFADLTVINSIEFWSGTNPIACNDQRIEGTDGVYTIKPDKRGYTIINHEDGTKTRLDFDVKEQAWSVANEQGESIKLMSFVDDTHVNMIMPDGTYKTIELSNDGVMAYSAICKTTPLMAYAR